MFVFKPDKFNYFLIKMLPIETWLNCIYHQRGKNRNYHKTSEEKGKKMHNKNTSVTFPGYELPNFTFIHSQ